MVTRSSTPFGISIGGPLPSTKKINEVFRKNEACLQNPIDLVQFWNDLAHLLRFQVARRSEMMSPPSRDKFFAQVGWLPLWPSSVAAISEVEGPVPVSGRVHARPFPFFPDGSVRMHFGRMPFTRGKFSFPLAHLR